MFIFGGGVLLLDELSDPELLDLLEDEESEDYFLFPFLTILLLVSGFFKDDEPFVYGRDLPPRV